MNVGFIGTGHMGNPMAGNLQKAGHALIVHDLRRDATENLQSAGAAWADTPMEVTQRTEVVFGSLPKPADVEHVFLGAQGILAGMRPGQAYFDRDQRSGHEPQAGGDRYRAGRLLPRFAGQRRHARR